MREPINPLFPIAEVRDARHLMEIALGMEHEAERRYRQLAATMDRAREPGLAALFTELADLEAGHEAGLGRWAEREGMSGLRPAEFSWRMPETFGDDGGDLLLLTPYRALATAVRNEERAFTFYAYLAAMAPDDRVRRLAEGLASEELSHVAQLRAMRRRAFHTAEPGEDSSGYAREAASTLEGLEGVAAGFERGSEELYDLAARELSQAGDETGAAIMRDATWQSRLLAGTGHPEGHTVASARAAGLLRRGMLTRDGVLRLCLRNAEEVLEIYLAAAERTADARVQARAQQLAEAAVGRLSMVRAQIAAVED